MTRTLQSAIMLFLLWGAVTASPAFCAPGPAPAETGTWWRDSGIVRGLQLQENQIRQIDQAFLSHRAELNSLSVDLQRQESILQTVIDNDQVDLKRAAAQIDQVVAARAKLEKEKTMMALDIRAAVTTEQWRKLQEMQRGQSSLAAAPAGSSGKPAARPETGTPAPDELIYPIGGPVTDPIPIRNPNPGYTAQARERKVEGTILLAVVIGKDGSVSGVRVLRGLGYGLDESAIDTVSRKWLFKPSTLYGRPVAVQATVEVTFR